MRRSLEMGKILYLPCWFGEVAKSGNETEVFGNDIFKSVFLNKTGNIPIFERFW
jgi:hypothetical protein